MKRKTIVFSALFTFLVIIAGISVSRSQYADKFKADVEKQRQRQKKDLETVRQQISEIQQMIKDKNLKFKAEITEALKQRIEDITGAEKPKNIEKEARVQSSLGEKMFLLFLKKLEEAERKKREGKKEEPYKKKEEPYKKKEEPAKKEETPDNKLPDKYMMADPSASAFNWRDAGKLSSVKHQGSCGSCWAFTAMGAFEGQFMIQNNGKELDLSEQYILDCAQDQYGRDAGSCGGGWYGHVFAYLMQNPVVVESVKPYKGRETPCYVSKKTDYKVVAWSYVKRDAGIPSTTEMKKAIAQHGPIAACVKVTPAFQAYAGGTFDEHASVSGERDINHGIVIVGWDDSKQSYLMKNSWGEQWGEKGYMWIEYGCNNIGYGAAWITVTKE